MGKPLESLADQLLNLSKWEEQTGHGSTSAPICPHCHTKQRPALCCPAGTPVRRKGTATCETCQKPFDWHYGPSPAGWAWHTLTLRKKGGA